MKIKELNGLNVVINKQLELILAILVVYLKQNPSELEELDFIEIPPVNYISELERLLNSEEHQQLIKNLLLFTDQSAYIKLALCLNDNYEFDDEKASPASITPYLGSVKLSDFIENFKSFANKIKWDDFFYQHNSYYQELLSSFCDFPENLNLDDIEQFYGKKESSYNYIPSILINGGFAHCDQLGNLYYIRGIQYCNEKNKFYYDKEYLLECLFHEFSHPIVNSLVDKYLLSFENLNEIYNCAIKQNLPVAYQNVRILLYEYFVRANAMILVKKYYAGAKIDKWIIEHGFSYLNDVVDYTEQNISNYDDYEDFFKYDMVYFFCNIFEKIHHK